MSRLTIEKETMLSQLTLVILTYQRHEYLLRNIRYWSVRGARLLVLDGSSAPLNADALLDMPDTIEYIHGPKSVYDRLRNALDLVKTPYAALLSDDEFFLPSGLLASIRALEADPEIVACMGQAIGFDYSGSQDVNGFAVYPKHAGYEIVLHSPGARMHAHMSDYACTTIYAVVRTEQWKRALAICLAKEFPVYAIGELQFELAISYFGKSKIIPVLHWLRSFEIGPVQGSEADNPSLTRKNVFHEWWLAPDKGEFRREFLGDMSAALAKTDGRDVMAVSKEIEVAMDAYANAFLDQKKITSRQELRTWLKSHLPTGVINAIRSFLRAYRIFTGRDATKKYKAPLRLAAQQMAVQGVQVDYDELSEVVDIIKSFHVNHRS